MSNSSQDVPHHEYLVAKVVSDETTEYYIRIQRSFKGEGLVQRVTRAGTGKPPATDNIDAARSPDVLAMGNNRIVQTVDLSSIMPQLRILHILVRIMTEVSVDYNLGSEDCYWLCGVIIDAVAQRFSVTPTRFSGYNRKAKFFIFRTRSKYKRYEDIKKRFFSELDKGDVKRDH